MNKVSLVLCVIVALGFLYIFWPQLGSPLAMHANANESPRIDFNFGTQNCGDCDWFVVLDGVMGGRSNASLEKTPNSIILSGSISLENNGGFASIRTPFSDYDLSGFSQVTLRYRSSGQDFAFSLNNYRRFFRPKFKHSVPQTDNEWQTLSLKFEDFEKMRLSQRLGSPPSQKELSRIIRLGLISNEKKASDFKLELDFIRFE